MPPTRPVRESKHFGQDRRRCGRVFFVAGDWTATGWPATMEGAVRSGYAAAQCVARVAGRRDAAFLVPDLPPSGFMRIFG